MGAPAFEPHYRVIILAPHGTVPATELVMKDARLHRRKPDGTTAPFSGFDFFVVRVEAAEQRSDFSCLPEIEAAAKRALDVWADSGICEAYEKHKRTAISAAMTSPDLVEDDRTRVVAALHKKFTLATGASGLVAAGPEVSFAEFIHANAPTLQEARLRGPFTLDEAFGG